MANPVSKIADGASSAINWKTVGAFVVILALLTVVTYFGYGAEANANRIRTLRAA